MGVGTVDVDFVELRETDVEVGCTELVDFLYAAGCLLAELVAWEVEDFQAFGMVFLIDGLQFVVLWCEAAAGGGVDDEEHFPFVVGEWHFLT